MIRIRTAAFLGITAGSILLFAPSIASAQSASQSPAIGTATDANLIRGRDHGRPVEPKALKVGQDVVVSPMPSGDQQLAQAIHIVRPVLATTNAD